MFDDLKIRNKLVLLVAGPIVIIVLLAALGVQARTATATEAAQVERLVGVARADSDVVDALQQESLYSTALVAGGSEEWKSQVLRAREATDVAVKAAVAELEANQGTSSGFRSSSTLAVDAADKLQYIREAVDQGYRWDQVVTSYASLQTSFLAVNDSVTEAVVDPAVAGDLRTASALAAYKSAVARQSAVLVGATLAGGFDAEGSYELFTAAVADETSEGSIFTSIAQTDRKGEVRDALSTDAHVAVETARDQAVDGGAKVKPAADARQLTVSAGTVLTDLHEVEAGMLGELIASSQAERATAERASNLFLVAAGIAILAAVAGAVLLGRRITKPLNHLADAADRLATESMPRLVESLRSPTEDDLGRGFEMTEEIRVDSKDEIGRLASAFNDVQRVANGVAAEQAALLRKGIGEMFVNLARRNQALLDRQIEFIDELERGEEDPDQLENLYRLDHLATRMRRNAESLLVLAGAEPPRRRGRPAPLANVVRAALAEVEDFGRIELLSFDEVLIASNAAADLAHLLSELMENAANFSPPETKVEVVGHRTKADGYVISVTDHGIGMSADQVAEANESLARPPLVGLALSRSLGFIVVGRLAARHGIAVRMMPSPSGGVTAVVSIPPSLVTDGPSLAGRDHEPTPAEVPSRLKPVLEAASSPSGAAPLTFSPIEVPGVDVAAESPSPAAEPVPAPLTLVGSVEEPDPASLPGRAMTATSPTLPSRTFVAQPPGSILPPLAAVPPPGAEGSSPLGGPMTFDPPAAGSADAPSPAAPMTFDPPAPTAAPEPAPMSFATPPADRPAPPAPSIGGTEAVDAPAARLDGPPPTAPLATRTPSARPHASSASAGGGERPFFLEDGAPPRLFGRTDESAPEPAAAPPVAPAPAPSTEPAGLFGGPPPAAAPTAPDPTADVAPPAPSQAPVERTGAGLARRVPRQSGGARPMPGSDAERGAGASRRSPDEVRNLLGRFRDGQQRARTEEPVPAGATHERESHE